MAGYNPSGSLPDYLVDPTTRKTWDEWAEILYPNGETKIPFWFRVAKFMTKLGFAVKNGKLVYDPAAYRK